MTNTRYYLRDFLIYCDKKHHNMTFRAIGEKYNLCGNRCREIFVRTARDLFTGRNKKFEYFGTTYKRTRWCLYGEPERFEIKEPTRREQQLKELSNLNLTVETFDYDPDADMYFQTQHGRYMRIKENPCQ